MQHAVIDKIHHAVAAVRQIAHTDSSVCDAADIEELILPIERELKVAHPSPQTLATYLNSLARSLRSDPAAYRACSQLDDAMRDTHIPTTWERH